MSNSCTHLALILLGFIGCQSAPPTRSPTPPRRTISPPPVPEVAATFVASRPRARPGAAPPTRLLPPYAWRYHWRH